MKKNAKMTTGSKAHEATTKKFEPVFYNEAPALPRPNPNFHQFQHLFWPCTDTYFNPLNAIFLAQISRHEELKAKQNWLIRDGVIPLFWFFQAHPKPSLFGVHLFLPIQCASIVPDAWKNNVRFYQLVQVARPAKKNILLTGILMPELIRLDLVKAKLGEIKKLVTGSNLQVCMPIRKANKDDDRVIFDLILELDRHFSDKYKLIRFKDIRAEVDFQTTQVHNLLSDEIIADSFWNQLFLSSGAEVVGVSTVRSIEDVDLPLSDYHGFQLLDGPTVRDEELAKKLRHRVTLADASRHFPWSTWLGSTSHAGDSDGQRKA